MDMKQAGAELGQAQPKLGLWFSPGWNYGLTQAKLFRILLEPGAWSQPFLILFIVVIKSRLASVAWPQYKTKTHDLNLGHDQYMAEDIIPV